jgi:hypothetical protein
VWFDSRRCNFRNFGAAPGAISNLRADEFLQSSPGQGAQIIARFVSATGAGVEGIIFQNGKTDRLRIRKYCAAAAPESDVRLLKSYSAAGEDCAYRFEPPLLRLFVPRAADDSNVCIAHAAEPSQAALVEERRTVRKDTHSETPYLRLPLNTEIKNALCWVRCMGSRRRR